jgi:hypothetical protein
LGNTNLDAVSLDCGNDQNEDNGAVSGPQRGAFTPRGSHSTYLSARVEVDENTIFTVFHRRGRIPTIELFRLSASLKWR